MVRRYTAEEAQAILARKECWDRGYHSTGLRAAAFFGEPPVFERRWHDQDEQCGHCDARVTVTYPKGIGIEVEE